MKEYSHSKKSRNTRGSPGTGTFVYSWASASLPGGRGISFMMDYYSPIQNHVFEKCLVTWKDTHYIRDFKKGEKHMKYDSNEIICM